MARGPEKSSRKITGVPKDYQARRKLRSAQIREVIMNRHLLAVVCGLLPWVAYTGCCRADTITDWDSKASAVASAAALGEREVAIVDLAMFDAINSIERRYQPYLVRLQVSEPTSAEAAAASAAATALALLHPQAANDFKTALAEYLAGVSAPAAAIEAG